MRQLVLVLLLGALGCASSGGVRAPPVSARSGAVQLGYASYYSGSLEGNATASGEPYDPSALTAAHRTLPLGTRISVTRTDTGRTVVVLVNDRGPYAGTRRIVDLSRAAARRLDMLRAGVVPVRLEVLGVPASRARR